MSLVQILVSGLLRLFAILALCGGIGSLPHPTIDPSSWWRPKSGADHVLISFMAGFWILLLFSLGSHLNRRADRKYAAALAREGDGATRDAAHRADRRKLPNRAGLIQSGLWLFMLACFHTRLAWLDVRALPAVGVARLIVMHVLIAALATLSGVLFLLGLRSRGSLKMGIAFAFGYTLWGIIDLPRRVWTLDLHTQAGMVTLALTACMILVTFGAGLSGCKWLRRTTSRSAGPRWEPGDSQQPAA
jgi:hypothetical protein